MTNQEKHFKENKEHSKIREDYPNSIFVQNPPKENSLQSILLSVTFYLSIIYLVLFVFFFNILGFFMLLIFLTPNFLGVVIGTILLGLGMKKLLIKKWVWSTLLNKKYSGRSKRWLNQFFRSIFKRYYLKK